MCSMSKSMRDPNTERTTSNRMDNNEAESLDLRETMSKMQADDYKNQLQDREREWKEVLLYESLRNGPKPDNPASWAIAVKQLGRYIETKQSILRSRLFNPHVGDEVFADAYSELVTNASNMLTAYLATDPAGRQEKDLEALAEGVHAALKAQGRKERSDDEILQDFLNAGVVEPYPINKKLSWVTDAHGEKFLIPNQLLPSSLNLPSNKLIVNKDTSLGRKLNLRSGDCVRLITNRQAGLGLPKGVEGYVLKLVSNKALGWCANYCQIMFILEYDEDTESWKEDFLEVTENELQRCDSSHPPSQWFPLLVSPEGRVKTTVLGSFKLKPGAKSYTYDELLDQLTGGTSLSTGQGADILEPGGSTPSAQGMSGQLHGLFQGAWKGLMRGLGNF